MYCIKIACDMFFGDVRVKVYIYQSFCVSIALGDLILFEYHVYHDERQCNINLVQSTDNCERNSSMLFNDKVCIVYLSRRNSWAFSINTCIVYKHYKFAWRNFVFILMSTRLELYSYSGYFSTKLKHHYVWIP